MKIRIKGGVEPNNNENTDGNPVQARGYEIRSSIFLEKMNKK